MKSFFSFPFWLSLLAHGISSSEIASASCESWLQEHVFNDTQLHFESEQVNSIYVRLDTFDQLDSITCDANSKLFETIDLLIFTEEKQLIERNLNFTGILNMITFMYPNEIQSILLTNVNGFNQFENAKKDYPIDMGRHVFFFKNVNFDFYLNKTRITRETCRQENFYEKQINFFWPMTKVFLVSGIAYTRIVCPYILSFLTLVIATIRG